MVENEPFSRYIFINTIIRSSEGNGVCVCECVHMWVYVCQGMYVYGVCVYV